MLNLGEPLDKTNLVSYLNDIKYMYASSALKPAPGSGTSISKVLLLTIFCAFVQISIPSNHSTDLSD